MREVDRQFAESGISGRCVAIGSQAKADDYCARHNDRAQCIGDDDMHARLEGFCHFLVVVRKGQKL